MVMTQAALHQDNRPALNCFGVKAVCLPGFWAEAWELLEPAAALSGLYTRESVLAALVAGDFQLWVAETDVMVMAAITEIAQYPALKQCAVVMAGGTQLDRCLPFLDTIEAWARENGCERMVVDGRRGWTRKLKGYVERKVTVVKGLYDG